MAGAAKEQRRRQRIAACFGLFILSVLVPALTACQPPTPSIPEPGVEELRLNDAASGMPSVLAVHTGVVDSLRAALEASTDVGQRQQVVDEAGQTLWREAVRQQRRSADDRPLYWSRLAMRRAIVELAPASEHSSLLQELESASRGLRELLPPQKAERVVLLTGFDPFFLDEHIDQSNPSGMAALALHGAELDLAGSGFVVRSVVVPVRFEDFDAGLIEHLAGTAIAIEAALVLTVSMGRSDFDLERFPGRRRSAEAPDNRNVLTGATAANPMTLSFAGQPLPGPEFVEFSLPAEAMVGCDSGPFEVRDNRVVSTLERGEFEAASLAELAGSTAVAGSGGGYLSNEISYRMLRALQAADSGIPSGHLHTPRVSGFDADRERDIVGQIRTLLACAVTSLD